MIQQIFDEWANFCKNMGSQVSGNGNCIISVNKKNSFSCDFSNSVVCQCKSDLDLEFSKASFSLDSFQSYIIILDKCSESSNIPYKKIASLMVLHRNRWFKSPYYSPVPSLPDKIRLFEINSSDLEDLATVIFSAFKYDKQYLKESIETYKTGVQSSYVSFYGLKVDDKLVSCLLVHCDESRQTYGIELVSTREEYQHQGYSKILLRYTINEMFNSKAEIIWLFAIKNSIAEALYSKIGFQSIAKILISSNA